eukprot:Protomagalhaensia_sp_Gyna_25__2810@NODE_2627_length_975_cov_5_783120_g2188_i0_p1_GENE_NODE_2627_length_975_cov_5_783120_g2188_i0NODE_2627_length_975_cov_5_783120_g2188_i0_p1_ORF_typecomplete_len168_score17_96DUF3552/PF12072_8/0_12_NODE_2627_length_975_cov_5_783120_g2188_i0100603
MNAQGQLAIRKKASVDFTKEGQLQKTPPVDKLPSGTALSPLQIQESVALMKSIHQRMNICRKKIGGAAESSVPFDPSNMGTSRASLSSSILRLYSTQSTELQQLANLAASRGRTQMLEACMQQANQDILKLDRIIQNPSLSYTQNLQDTDQGGSDDIGKGIPDDTEV